MMQLREEFKPQENGLGTLATALIEFSPLGIYIIQDRKFKVISPEFVRIVGYTERELRARHPLSIVYPDDRDQVRQAAIMMLKGKRQSPYQFRIVTNNGSERWILEKVASIEYKGQRATLGNFMDITEQVRMHGALAESEALLNGILASSPIGIGLVEDMAIKWTNRSMAEILGYSSEEDLVGKEVKSLCASQNEYQRIEKAIGDKLTTNDNTDVDIRFIRKDGKVIDGELRVAWLDGQGEQERYVAILSDISHRKQTQAALESEKQRLAVTLRSIGDGVICTDPDGNIVLMNKVAEELTGYSEDEAVSRPLHEVFKIVDELSRDPYEDLVKKVMEAGKAIELLEGIVLIAKDGTERLIADSVALVRDSEGKAHGVIVVFRDITTKRALEAELARTQKLEAIGTLAGGIAHDFNNMLMGILGYITLARMSLEGPQEVLDSLRKAEQACMRAKALSQKLITFSSGGEPVKEVGELSSVICDSVDFALSGSNVKAECQIDEDLCKTAFDRGQMEQVIHNIVANAVEAMPRGGKIVVKAENVGIERGNRFALPEGNYVRISVKDQGLGMRKEDQERAFDPFFTTKEAGRGLGLSITHSIVERHGGKTVIDSHPGLGTEVQIYLPAAEDRTCLNHKLMSSETPTRVLLMDDEPAVREVTSKMLAHLGFDVEFAEDGQQAIDLYGKAMELGQPFGAVILDLTVPGGMGGKETMERLKEIDPTVKAIVASGYCDDPVMNDYAAYGFKGRLFKPYKMDDLASAVRKIASNG